MFTKMLTKMLERLAKNKGQDSHMRSPGLSFLRGGFMPDRACEKNHVFIMWNGDQTSECPLCAANQIKGMGARSFIVLVDRVLDLIPASDYYDLSERLKDLRRSAAYTAPEGHLLWWKELGYYLSTRLPYPPQKEWQRDILRLVTGEEPTEVEDDRNCR